MFANEVGEAYLLLGPAKLGVARAAVWRGAVSGAADFLVANKNLAYYTNGNINLADTLTMALAAKLTGDPKYLTDEDTAWSFVVSPTRPRWAGYGWVTTKDPIRPDGADGAGYFAEAGAHGPGFDPGYAQFQSSVLARIYLLTGDRRALMYMNMLVNQLLPVVNTTTWQLTETGGARSPSSAPRYLNFVTAALPLLAYRAGRADLLPLVSSQQAFTARIFRGAEGYTNIGMYYDLGDNATTAALATSPAALSD